MAIIASALLRFARGEEAVRTRGYENNMVIIERSKDKIPAGSHTILLDTTIAKPGASAEVTLSVDGRVVEETTVNRTVPAAFTASETSDLGVDLGSPVSRDYFRPCTVQVRWLDWEGHRRVEVTCSGREQSGR